MPDKSSLKYPRTYKSIEHTMKVLQREMEDGRLKVQLLGLLVNIREHLIGD